MVFIVHVLVSGLGIFNFSCRSLRRLDTILARGLHEIFRSLEELLLSAFSKLSPVTADAGLACGTDRAAQIAASRLASIAFQRGTLTKSRMSPNGPDLGRADWRLSPGAAQAAQYARHEERYARIADAVPFGIWIFSADGGIRSLSASFLALVGVSLAECSRIDWTDLVHPDDRSRVKSQWRECMASRKLWDCEFRVAAADSSVRVLLSRGAPLSNSDSSVLEYGGVHLDITERVLEQEEMARLQAELEKRVSLQTTALRELSRRLMNLQDEERRRIARELHDSTGQSLTAIKINLDLLGREARGFSPESRKLFEELLALVDSCSAGVRTISHLLHPPLLDELGLIPALRWYVEGFVERSGILVELDLHETSAVVPRDVNTALFRILQETLTNILKHSAAPSARISLTEENGRIILEVRDFGRGFAPELLEERNRGIHGLGVGITGMRERVAQLAGELSIQNGSPGAVVRASFPISNSESR